MAFKTNARGCVCAGTCNVGKRDELWKALWRGFSKGRLTVCGRKASEKDGEGRFFELKKVAVVENLRL